MDKYLVRRAPSSRPSRQGEDSKPDSRTDKAKRVKTEHSESPATPAISRHSSVKSVKSLADDDAESSGADADASLLGDSYDGIPFDEPLASLESLEEVMGGEGSGGDDEKKTGGILYRSSIYVDAFNIALDTVLEQEEHLFNDREKAVFAAWRQLDYEAKYLYVRLFLRKQAAWHRTQRLGYHSNIGDLQTAIEILQEERDLSDYEQDNAQPTVLSDAVPQDWSLGLSFAFAQSLDEVETSVDEVVGLLSLDELKLMAKQMKAVGKSKAELQAAIVRVTTKQMTLMSAGLRRHLSTDSAAAATATAAASPTTRPSLRRNSSTSSGREEELVSKVMAITGPCIRICPSVFKLFERVHLVFYRTSEWTEKSLTTIVLAKMSKRNFPEYVVSRTANIFASRQQLLDFEEALRLQYRIDQILNFEGHPGNSGFRQVLVLFSSISDHWHGLVEEELSSGDDDEYDEYSYLRRFKASHVLTRIAHYAAYCMGRLHDYRSEYALLNELLDQRLLHLARRGAWYQRKALIEERYMATADPVCDLDEGQQKKLWWRRALETCETALQDRDCHIIFHHDLQKRILKLEKRLRIPRRLQHDFGHLQLLQPEEHSIEGIQIKRIEAGMAKVERTIWIDEHADEVKGEGKDGEGGEGKQESKGGDKMTRSDANRGGLECTVEEMCLSDYRRKGWKGYHAEGGIIQTLFAYLFYDVLFLYIPNVFQTAYQACPLDLHTDVFYAARASEINRRLVEIANGEAPRIVREVHAAQFARRTCIVGLRWEFALDDVAELAACFNGDALALVCKVMAQEYRQRGGGLPDLLLWRTEPTPEVLFSEVKSANDRLSDTQRMWIHVLTGAGVRVAVCHAIAKETRVRG
ncbi:coiled-coil domain-containing protein mtmr15 [Ophiostoma piceae UAMH 11346]|uniref:Fanconi-associated nuclease n=1 Tax=Ophiostoma piceae (strain UAMH 11346) TaxID=1262450 RepID=S3BSW0_OPHP1|nr:coiled-coil domain-containing protein mtmr15 [Ophiostoma piceae UAMH 11346]